MANGNVQDRDDNCMICYQLLYDPVVSKCHHTACHACLLSWAVSSATTPSRVIPETLSTPSISSIQFSCPACRTETTATADVELAERLKVTYPDSYGQGADGPRKGLFEHNDGTQSMIISIGNTHKKIPPSISPYSGNIRTHYWKFFIVSSHPEVIDSVDLILHESFQHRRFITLKKHPFASGQRGWGYFRLAAYVTLKPGWEWQDGQALNSEDRGSRKDRLHLTWVLDFKDSGSQCMKLLPFTKIEAADDIVSSIQNIFVTEGHDD